MECDRTGGPSLCEASERETLITRFADHRFFPLVFPSWDHFSMALLSFWSLKAGAGRRSASSVFCLYHRLLRSQMIISGPGSQMISPAEEEPNLKCDQVAAVSWSRLLSGPWRSSSPVSLQSEGHWYCLISPKTPNAATVTKYHRLVT